MSLLKKLALSSAIVFGLFSNNLEASLSNRTSDISRIPKVKREISGFKNPYIESFRKSQKNRLDYEATKEIINNLSISYEEWKRAIENPNSKEAYDLAFKSKIISIIGEQLVNNLPTKEKEEYSSFWKYFRIKTEGIIPDNCDIETFDLITNYSIPVILDMQIDISKLYKNLFNFNNLSEGDKFLIYTHIKHDLKYQSSGNKRKTYVDRLIEEKLPELEIK